MKLKNDDINIGSGVQPNIPNNSGNDAYFEQFSSDNIIPEFKQGYEQNVNQQNDLYADPVFTTDVGGNNKRNIKDVFLKGGGGSAARPNWTLIFYVFMFIVVFVMFFNNFSLYFRNKRIVSEGNTTEAIVTDVRGHHSRSGRSYSVYVSYEVNGVKYHNVYVKSSSSYQHTGDIMTIYYDKDIPGHITYSGGASSRMIAACVSLVFLGGIGYMIYVAITDPEKAARMFNRRGSWRRMRRY